MNEILMEGTSLMCVGMGTVFSFLCVLILAMILMSKVVLKLNEIFPEPVAQVAGQKTKKVSSSDEEIAVAVLAAMLKK